MFQFKMLDVGESVSNLKRFDEENDDAEQISDEIDWAIKNQHTQFHFFFKQNFYLKYHGLKPTVFAVANGSYQYGKSRSKEQITMKNKIGTSESYPMVRKRKKLMALLAEAESKNNQVPIPS